MLRRFPELADEVREYMDPDDPLVYLGLGGVVIPNLEEALRIGDLAVIVRFCAFLEDIAVASQSDPRLGNLLAVEIGEWINHTADEDRLAPWLGSETKRICGYVPGLATQRFKDRVEEPRQESFAKRVAARLLRARNKGQGD